MTDNGDYIQTISDYFLQKKGKGLMLSPGDVALLLTWEAAHVPRNAVIRGIDRTSAALDRVLSLRACRKFVDEEVGKLPRFIPQPTIIDTQRERLEGTAAMLSRAAKKHTAVAAIITHARERVEALDELLEPDAEVALSEELAIVESGLADALLGNQSDEERAAVTKRIGSSLADVAFSSREERLKAIDETMTVWILLKYDIDFSLI
ncbi:MAG: hypothetical protein GY771_01915 [bacterium]|nr:hypothetical protein [bacterium]